MSWSSVIPTISKEQRVEILERVASEFKGRSLADMRGNKEQLVGETVPMVQAALSRASLTVSPDEIQAIAREIVARIGGLGFLEPMLRIESGISEIAVTPAGGVWTIKKGDQDFQRVDISPSQTEVWRAVETLLAPLGRAVTEASPSVDAKIPRQEGLPGGARVKIIHPQVAPGKGYPSINIRLFEPKPVPPEQLVKWEVAPQKVIDALVHSVGKGLRVLVVGGTASGKTTVLSALCYGIPKTARVVKIEDPEEIWMDHPHVVSLEARPAQVGSAITPYSLADGVDDAMRMSPRWLIVGEMRRGDAVAALFRAQMSDHPGLSTFHAESPEAAVKRLSLLLFTDEKVNTAGAKSMFAEAVDLLVQVGFRDVEENGETLSRRRIIGVWGIEKELHGGDVKFIDIYSLPGANADTRSSEIQHLIRSMGDS
jgi:pilus assembly protein CpaF